MPSAVHTRYEGIGWYVSARICTNAKRISVQYFSSGRHTHLAVLDAYRRDDVVRVADAI